MKEKADRLFSIFIRLIYSDFQGYCECYTCGIKKKWEEMECGHFRPRGYISTRFDKDNARPQCHSCNCHRDGMVDSFEEHLRDDLGDHEVDELIKRSRAIANFSDDDYKNIVHTLRLKIKKLGVTI